MSKKNDLLKYLNLLFEAKAELTGDPVAPIRYNGYEWEGEMSWCSSNSWMPIHGK